MSNLVYVQFNANLMEKNKRRKARSRETVSDDMGTRTSARLRELYEEEFESEGEVEVDEEIEYESDGVQIIEQYGPDKDGASI
nr:zinc finger, BED-type [Tanacetum cinerariifolium]